MAHNFGGFSSYADPSIPTKTLANDESGVPNRHNSDPIAGDFAGMFGVPTPHADDVSPFGGYSGYADGPISQTDSDPDSDAIDGGPGSGPQPGGGKGPTQKPYTNPHGAAQGPHEKHAVHPGFQGGDPKVAFKRIHEVAENQAQKDPALFKHPLKGGERKDVHKYTRSQDLPKDNPYHREPGQDH